MNLGKILLHLVVMPLALVGCVVKPHSPTHPHYWETEVNQWLGREAIALWRTWGVPTKIVTAPNGNEMHIYIGKVSKESSGSSFFETGGLAVGGKPTLADCETDFEVDASKTIIGAIWRGDACPESHKQGRPKWLAAVPIGF